jgi:hypothetical protein
VVLLLLHTPLVDASVSVSVPPTHTADVSGEIGDDATTVRTLDAEHPPNVYVIEDVPLVIPVSEPVPETIVATAVLPLAHVPPDGKSDMVLTDPTQVKKSVPA